MTFLPENVDMNITFKSLILLAVWNCSYSFEEQVMQLFSLVVITNTTMPREAQPAERTVRHFVESRYYFYELADRVLAQN